MAIMHFGIQIWDKPSNHIDKERYLSANLSSASRKKELWTEEKCEMARKLADVNYDLNMAYFQELDSIEFGKYVMKKCQRHRFTECFDLKGLDGKSGIYILVLDSYKQIYIGNSENMKKRIMAHWNGTSHLDELVFNNVFESVISINAFGALDTTRIFYKLINKEHLYSEEKRLGAFFDDRYKLNRLNEGIGSVQTQTEDELSAKIAMMKGAKKRDMTKYVDAKKLQIIIDNDYREECKLYFSKHPSLKLLLMD